MDNLPALSMFWLNKLQWGLSLIKIWGVKEAVNYILKFYLSTFLKCQSWDKNINKASWLLAAAHIHSEVFSANLWLTLDPTGAEIQPIIAECNTWTMIVSYTGMTGTCAADCRTVPKDWFSFITGASVWLQDSQAWADHGPCKPSPAQAGPTCRL